MPEPVRASNGHFAAQHSRLALYEIVREVALVAAERDADALKDPRTVSEAAWNSARAALEPAFGSIPRANGICRQLSDRRGRPFAWAELLDALFDEAKDMKRLDEQRLAETPRTVTRPHVDWALTAVAAHLRKRTLLPHEYDEGRESLLRSLPPRRRAALLQRLPTEGQILNACGGSWDLALGMADLEARPAVNPPRHASVRVVDAIVFFYAKAGYLPTNGELDDFAAREGFAKQSIKGKRWHEHIADAVEAIAAMRWPEPPTYREGPRSGWQPIPHVLIAAPPHHTGTYTRVEVITAVREFLAGLPSGAKPTDKRWRAFSRGRANVPSLNVTKAHGGLRELVLEAGRVDWHERAQEWVDPRPGKGPRARPAAERLAGRAAKPEARAVRRLLNRTGEMTARELARELGWTIPKVRGWLDTLVAAGQIEKTQAWANSKKQSYRRVDRARL